MKEIPIWFPGARLNYAENLLFHQHDAIACTAIREIGTVEHYTFRELRELVREMAAALRVNGLQVGDRVAGTCFLSTYHKSVPTRDTNSCFTLLYLAIVTNSVSALVIALATASIGAVFSSTAPDMGVQVPFPSYYHPGLSGLRC